MAIGLGAGLVKARDAILNPDFGPQGAMDVLSTWMGQELAKELLNQKIITPTSTPEEVLEKLLEERPRSCPRSSVRNRARGRLPDAADRSCAFQPDLVYLYLLASLCRVYLPLGPEDKTRSGRAGRN